ncbi:MAG: hypothetical protein AAGL29_14620 [Bacteroidota bacterium]
MKLLCFVISLNILACGSTDQDVLYTFSISNNSGEDITIRGYNSNIPDRVQRTIVVPYLDRFEAQFRSRDSGPDYDFSDVFEGDSIIIDYNNLRTRTFTCIRRGSQGVGCSESRNILNVLPEPVSGQDILAAEYEFTETDFENALPIN